MADLVDDELDFDDHVKKLTAVAKAAMKLMMPPYCRYGGMLRQNQEWKDWEALREALIVADYKFEEHS